MSKCKETGDPKNPDFKNPNQVLNSLLSLFKVGIQASAPIAKETILASAGRQGLSPSKIAANIIRRQSEAGIPVGPLASGGDNPSEIMELIRVQEIVNAIVTDAVTEVAVLPGAPVTSTGLSPLGPIVSQGNTTNSIRGNAIIR